MKPRVHWKTRALAAEAQLKHDVALLKDVSQSVRVLQPDLNQAGHAIFEAGQLLQRMSTKFGEQGYEIHEAGNKLIFAGILLDPNKRAG